MISFANDSKAIFWTKFYEKSTEGYISKRESFNVKFEGLLQSAREENHKKMSNGVEGGKVLLRTFNLRLSKLLQIS